MTESKKLMQVFNKFGEKNTFQVGDLVKWKPNCDTKTSPRPGRPAVVVSLHPERRNTTESPATPYFEEPLDITIGVLGEDTKDFLCFPADSRRFEPYTEE